MEVRFYGMLLLSSNCPRPLGRWENAIWKTIWRTIQRDSITFGAAVEYHPSSPNDQARIHQFGKKLLPGILIGFELVAWENLERRYFDRRRGRFGKLDATDFYPRRINAEAHKKWWIRADGTATLLAGSCEPRTHSGAGTDREGRTNRWRWSPCRHLVDPRWLQLSSSQWTSSFNSTCRRKKHSFFWEYIDVTSSTHTDLDVLQEKTIDDYWNVDSNRSLSDSWTGFSKFTRLKEKTSTEIHVVRKENDKNSHDDQTQIMVCKYRRELVTPLRIEKKQELAKEKLELDNARKMKGFYFIDPDVRESSEIL